MTDTADQDKAALRAGLRARRAALKQQSPDAGVHAALAFEKANLGPFRAAAIYHPRGAEMDPFPLAAILRRHGVEIALPVVVERDAPLVFRLESEGQLPPDAIGIPAPPPQSPAVRPDLIVCPVLAFDGQGGRMGQGGGYYDRTLAALRADGAPLLAIGLAFAGQEHPGLPAGPFDQPLDGVLTEKGYRPFGPERT